MMTGIGQIDLCNNNRTEHNINDVYELRMCSSTAKSTIMSTAMQWKTPAGADKAHSS